MIDLLAHEYGWTVDEIKKLSSREISDFVDAIITRKTGYKKESAPEVKLTDEQEKKIQKLIEDKLHGK